MNKCELDCKVTELEVMHEKASVICEDLTEGYFHLGDPEDWFLKTYYGAAGTKARILLDYLAELKETISYLRKVVEETDVAQ